MAEHPLVAEAHAIARRALQPPLSIERGAPLLYAVTVNNALQVTVNPKKPVRGQSAFETDLCVFEQKTDDINIPRLVMEFKHRITTHDIITYSAKTRKHKQVYPYLRYGIVMSGEVTIPGRLFLHNEALDFGLAVLGAGPDAFAETLGRIITREVEASRQLEEIAFSKPNATAFYSISRWSGSRESVGTRRWSPRTTSSSFRSG
jgi:hypothetical protein